MLTNLARNYFFFPCLVTQNQPESEIYLTFSKRIFNSFDQLQGTFNKVKSFSSLKKKTKKKKVIFFFYITNPEPGLGGEKKKKTYFLFIFAACINKPFTEMGIYEYA